MFFKNTDNKMFDIYRDYILLRESLEEGDVMDSKFFEEYDLKLTQARVRLMAEYPYYGILLSKLKVCPTNEVDTMAVDNHANIYMNPDFTMKLSKDEIIAVLAHEVSHILTHSFARQKDRSNHTVWNIATDFMMNLDLVEMGMQLPKGACIPKKRGDEWFAVLPTDPPFEANITKMDAEDLYEALEKEIEKNKKDKKEENKQGGKGKPDQLKKPFKNGDRVQSRTTGKNGTITSVIGNTYGKQTLTIDWDDDSSSTPSNTSQKTNKTTSVTSALASGLKTEAIESGIPSTDVMPLLSGNVEFSQCEGGAVEGEDFALDKDAKVTYKPSSGKGEGGKEQKKSSKGGGSSDKGPKTKGRSLADIIDQMGKDRDQFDKHITASQGQHPKVIKTPTNDPDYQPDFHENPETQIQSKVQSAISEAAKRGGGPGNIPRSLRLKPEITTTPWKRLIRDFLSGLEKTKPTYNKLDKRSFSRGYPIPAQINQQTKIKTILAIDTSGSISENVLTLFMSEIFTILSQFRSVEMKLILWNTEAYDDIDIDSSKTSVSDIMSKLRYLPVKSGGTLLTSVKTRLEANYSQAEIAKYAGIIVFTDGDVEEKPEMPRIHKKLFLLTRGGTDKRVKNIPGANIYKIDPYNG